MKFFSTQTPSESAAWFREAAKHFRNVPHYAAAFELAADIREWAVSRPTTHADAMESLTKIILAFVERLAAPTVTDEEFFDSFAGITGETVSE